MQKNKSLCKIYSRNRVKIFNLNKRNSKQINVKFFYFCFVIIIAIFTYVSLYKGIEPIFNAICSDEARAIATKVTNEQSTKAMENYKYNDIFNIEKDEAGNIQMISANIFVIDEIVSDIGLKIQQGLDESKNSTVKFPLGSFTGIKMLAGMGPNIKLKINTIGKVNTDIKSEFVSTGVNQTIHRVYLQVDCVVSILTPYEVVEEDIMNQVLLLENVIIGKVPSAYYNLEGIEGKKDLFEIVE